MTVDRRNADLRRQSFAGQELEAADFEGADLRGADFSRARLARASFKKARLGVPAAVGAAVFALSIALSIAAGVVTGLSLDAVRTRLLSPGWEQPSGAAGIVVILVVFVAVVFWKGIDAAFKTFGVTFAIVLALSLIVRLVWGSIDVAVAARGIGLALVLALAVLAGILGRVVGGTFGAWAIAVVAVLGGIAAGRAEGGLAALVVSVSLVVISKRTLRADPRDRTLRRAAHWIVSRWGTRFVDADLTTADFSGTTADHCDITGATIDGVRWEPGHAPLSVADTEAVG